jgi:GST-like protein
MIELWGMSSPNVVKVLIALAELGLGHRFHYVDVIGGEQFRPEFLAISPNNKVPVLRDEEGPDGGPITVFESAAILLYLSRKTGRLLSDDPIARTRELEWLMVQVSTVGPMLGQWNHFQLLASPRESYGRERYNTERLRILDMLERRLADAEYLGGRDYSLADIATFPWISNMVGYLGPETGAALAAYPSLGRWFARVGVRPAVRQALAETDTIRELEMARRSNWTADDIDRFVGRGRHARV